MFLTDHINNRPYSIQTRSIHTTFTTDHVHNQPHS